MFSLKTNLSRVALLLGLTSLFTLVRAQEPDFTPGAITLLSATGDVTFKAPGSDTFEMLPAGGSIPQGAIVKTGAGSVAEVELGSGSLISVAENSQIEFTQFLQQAVPMPQKTGYEPAPSVTEISVIDGTLTCKAAKLRDESTFVIHTPAGDSEVVGTTFQISFDAKTGRIQVIATEGQVSVVLVNTSISMSKVNSAAKKVAKDRTKVRQTNSKSSRAKLKKDQKALKAAERKAIGAAEDAVDDALEVVGGETMTARTGEEVVISPLSPAERAAIENAVAALVNKAINTTTGKVAKGTVSTTVTTSSDIITEVQSPSQE